MQNLEIIPEFNSIKQIYPYTIKEEFVGEHALDRAQTVIRNFEYDSGILGMMPEIKKYADKLFEDNKDLNRALYWLLKKEKKDEGINLFLSKIPDTEKQVAARVIDGSLLLDIEDHYSVPQEVDSGLVNLLVAAKEQDPLIGQNYIYNQALTMQNFILAHYPGENKEILTKDKQNVHKLENSFCEQFGNFYRFIWQLAYDLLIPRTPLRFKHSQ